jgi:hypothetical protein
MRKTDRTYIPAIMGEYLSEDQVRTRAQEFFLITVWNVAPTALRSLRDDVLPKYRLAFPDQEDRSPNDEIRKRACEAIVDLVWKDKVGNKKLPAEYHAAVAANPLLYGSGAALIAWSKQFNLTGKWSNLDSVTDRDLLTSTFTDDFWPLVAAVETIFWWHFAPAGWLHERGDRPSWRPKLSNQFPKEPEVLPEIRLTTENYDVRSKASISVESPGWYIQVESESNFRTRMLKDFKRWLDSHIDDRKEAARKAGWVKGPGRRELSHFSWAVRFQVGKESAAQIARECNRSEEAVDDGVETVLAMIHLDRRPGLKGPKRGARKL